MSWKDHKTNIELYGNLPTLSSTIRQRRMRFTGHCLRANNQPAEKLLFWSPYDGKTQRGGGYKTFSKMLQEDTGLKSHNELRTLMGDRDLWKVRVENSLDYVSPMGD